MHITGIVWYQEHHGGHVSVLSPHIDQEIKRPLADLAVKGTVVASGVVFKE